MTNDDDLTAIPLLSPNSNASSPAWNALVATLTSQGIVRSAGSKEPVDCKTVADLLMGSDDDNSTESPPPLLLLLVGGSWCAPCRNFTPVLMKCMQDINDPTVKVLFCSADHDQASFQTYYAKMPLTWSAIPYDEDAEDERDDLLEALNANTLPTLLVLDPISGRLLEQNAVHVVQAGGSGENFTALLQKWRGMIVAGESAAATAKSVVEEKKDSEPTQENSNSNNELHYFVPAPPVLICQYFREQLLSPNLPEALQQVILRRELLSDDDIDANTLALADSICGDNGNNNDRWLFRTAAPALPMSWYGSSVLGLVMDASALEVWTFVRDTDSTIVKATCTIENETGRSLLVFRETITMEMIGNGSGCNVTKTLDLSGVPSLGHTAFTKRWRNESELIFHALLGTCDRKKKSDK